MNSAPRSTRVRLAGSPGAIGGVGSPKSAAAAVIRSTSMESVELAGQDKPGVKRGEGGLKAGRAHGRLLEGHFLLIARVGSVVGGDAVDGAVAQAIDERLAIGLGGERRMHLHPGVHRAQRVVGEQEVVRAHLGAQPKPAGLAVGDGAHGVGAARGAGSARGHPRNRRGRHRERPWWTRRGWVSRSGRARR